jgi:BON domain
MKTCPRCEKTYPDAEQFCADDGTALVAAGPAFTQAPSAAGGAAAETQIECPVCGGRAEPGEVICNFCGTRLGSEPAAEPVAFAPPQPPPVQPSARGAGRPPEPQGSGRFTGKMPAGEPEEEEGGGRVIGAIGYILAAVVALAGGAWLALHLSSRQVTGPVTSASPSAAASPAAMPSGMVVALAQDIPIQVMGESASAPERDHDAARKVFDANRAALLDAYKHALGGDASAHDGMMVRLRIMPDGSVTATSVRTSTAPNPGLDAEVVKYASGWTFPSFSGGQTEIDYPMIFARNDSERAAVESDLKTKLASLNPAEPPEYAAAPAPSPAAAASAGPPVVTGETPAAAATPAEAAAPPAVAVPKPRPPRERVARPRPTPSLRDRVQEVLKGNRKLGRVQFYTDRGTVVLFGKVFDDNDKRLAERTVRSVAGVTAVNNTLTTDVAEWAAEQVKIQRQLANAGLPNVTVKVIGRDAYLSGSVKTALERDRAVTITQGAAPVIVRGNLIRVEPGSILGF